MPVIETVLVKKMTVGRLVFTVRQTHSFRVLAIIRWSLELAPLIKERMRSVIRKDHANPTYIHTYIHVCVRERERERECVWVFKRYLKMRNRK